MDQQKPVTISVLTYNSSKFVLETLESIKNQTYPRLILHICDDCSTDDTIVLCKDWIAKNRDRFESTNIIVPEHNTGISANCNRAWDTCTTKYEKEIAGDDILLPNCIADNVAFVDAHPDAALVFSRIKTFGASKERCRHQDEEVFIYDFFAWSTEEQYSFLHNNYSCIPAPTCFVNIEKVRSTGLRHDERIPMMEDVVKWQNALKLGIRFHFLDKITVNYRINENSLSTATLLSPKYFESRALYWFYYHFVQEYAKDSEKAIGLAVKEQMNYYNLYCNEVRSVRMSRRYRVASQIVNAFLFFKPFVRMALYPLVVITRPIRHRRSGRT